MKNTFLEWHTLLSAICFDKFEWFFKCKNERLLGLPTNFHQFSGFTAAHKQMGHLK